MRTRKLDAFITLWNKPLLLSLTNLTKSDIREFVKATFSIVNDTETEYCFNTRTTVVDVKSTTVAVKQKVLLNK